MRNILIMIIFLLGLMACEEEFIPDTTSVESGYVVEGFVEAGIGSIPSYVLLTRSVPFLSTISSELLQELSIKDAEVKVNDGDNWVNYTQVCLSDLPVDQQDVILKQLGISADSVVVDYCLYVDLLDQLKRDFGREYTLDVQIDEDEIHAVTTIPALVPLDSIYFEDLPGEPIEGLLEMNIAFQDPMGLNFYRYLTGEADGVLISPFASVTDDALFDGQAVDIPLQKAEQDSVSFLEESYGYFETGDTITLKWCMLDQAHFDFWNTFEFAINSQGPFSSYTRVSTNVEGALGVWGGYGVEVRTILVEK